MGLAGPLATAKRHWLAAAYFLGWNATNETIHIRSNITPKNTPIGFCAFPF